MFNANDGDLNVDGLTFYDPNHVSSDDDSNDQYGPPAIFRAASERLARGGVGTEEDDEGEDEMRNKSKDGKRYKLTSGDVQLLRLITDAADRKIHSNREEIRDNLDETDFAELFQTFKAFTERNGINSQSSPTYYTCLNVIVHLCSYSQPTWRQRFNQLFQEYSVIESRRIKQEDLNRKLKNVLLEKKLNVLKFWYNKYVQQSMYAENLMIVANTRDKLLLKRDSFRLWRYSLGVQQWMLASTQLRYERNLLFASFKRLYDKSVTIKEDTQFAKLFILAKFIRKWKSRCDYHKALTDSAIKQDNSRLQYRLFGDWTYKYYEEMAKYHHNDICVATSFRKWKEKTVKLIDNHIQTEDKYERKLNTKVFDHWTSLIEYRNEQNARAVSLYTTQLKEKYFSLLIKYTQLSILARPLINFSSRATQLDVLQNWHLRTLQSLEAKRFQDFMLCHRMLRSWRLKTGAMSITRGIDANIVKQRFHLWLLSERLQLMVRYRNNVIASKILRQWFIRSRRSCRNQWALEKEAIRYDKCNTQLKILHSWQAKTKELFETNEAVIQMNDRWLLKRYFGQYFAAVYEISKDYRTACKMHEKYTTRHAIAIWKESAYKRKQKRLSIAYQDIKNKFKTEKLQVIFAHWQARSSEILENEILADTVNDKRETSILSTVFEHWNSRVEDIDREYERASYTYDDNLLATMFDKWRSQNNKITQDMDIVSLRILNKNISILSKTLRTWNYRLAEIRRDINFADEIYSKRQNSRFGRIWKLWSAKLHEKKLQTQLLAEPGMTRMAPPNTIARIPQTSTGSPRPPTTRPRVGPNTEIRPRYETTLLETPSRAKAGGFIPLTSIDQWRKMKRVLPYNE